MANETRVTDRHPGMMGDGTEEQNLDQPGNPSARISEEEVEGAFESPGQSQTSAADLARGIAPKVKERIEASQEWLGDKTDAALRWSSGRVAQAEQVISERPAIVVTASALTALTVGFLFGFLLGRADAERSRGLSRHWGR